MPGELKNVADDFVASLDAMDVERMMQAVSDDAQSVDEISRRWLRGRVEIDDYLRGLMASVSDVRTELKDAEERVWGDTGILTCWLDQDYKANGDPQHVSAPTTLVFRRDGGEWKVALFHSIPLPEQP